MNFRSKDAVVGPPLTMSVAKYLKDAGVKFALAIYDEGRLAEFFLTFRRLDMSKFRDANIFYLYSNAGRL